ncbi:MAG TPA: ATPase domain-containing protein, partial [Steroidobacteraceae bacterium]|nr:ATPase domain-containing protein [Steroidobacteraceae bacterium]
MSDSIRTTGRVATGIPGLDEVLHGGVPRGSLVLVEGRPGSGKTTFGLQCLIHGAAIGETCLFVTNAESPSQLEAIAASHEWDLTGVHMFEWAESPGASDAEPAEYTLFPEDEVEVGESLQRLFAEMDRVKQSLLVIDTLSSLRGLAPTQAYHRRQMRRLREALRRCGRTGLLLDDATRDEKGARSRTLADALIELRQIDVNYGADRRRLRVRKVRGSTYVSGAHDFSIVTGGLVVYPRLIAGKHASVSNGDPLASGNAALDALSGGGLPRGSSTLIMGPAGIGKSTLATSYAVAAAAKGERCLVLLFDEAVSTFLVRSRGLGLEIDALSSSGHLRYTHLDPAERSPGEISHYVLEQVEREGVSVVVIDTLNGYLHSAVSEPDV